MSSQTSVPHAASSLSGGETSDTFVATAPPSGGVAPPGWYLLFVVDDDGTPSVGHRVQLR